MSLKKDSMKRIRCFSHVKKLEFTATTNKQRLTDLAQIQGPGKLLEDWCIPGNFGGIGVIPSNF